MRQLEWNWAKSRVFEPCFTILLWKLNIDILIVCFNRFRDKTYFQSLFCGVQSEYDFLKSYRYAGIIMKCFLLTLPSPGCFWSFRHNLRSANTIEILKLFGGLGHSWHPCDQIHMGIGPTQAFLSELWGFKVDRGRSLWPPSPEKVGLKNNNSLNKS